MNWLASNGWALSIHLGMSLPAACFEYDIGILRSQQLLVGNEFADQLREGQCVRHADSRFSV